MFGQLLPNKNKIATVWRDTYYAKFESQFWNLNEAELYVAKKCLFSLSIYVYYKTNERNENDSHSKESHLPISESFDDLLSLI
jgi:hypothetical protein